MKTLAIIVNYHASALIADSVCSVLDSPSLGPVQVVIVDNSMDPVESARLQNMPVPSSRVELIVSAENMGFGRACNMAFDRHDCDVVLLLNPDARLLGDCLLRLQNRLASSADIGAVGPQVFWDADHEFILPPAYPPIFYWLLPVTSVASPDSVMNRAISAIWRRFAMKVWRAIRPVRVQNLSGGNVLIKREAILKAGGLFDPQFFLYYEDTDLFIRIRQAGYRLLLEPDARAVHYYDQCDQGNWQQKRALMAESHRQFMKKHCKGWRRLPGILMAPLVRRCCRAPENKNMEIFHEPFTREVPRDLKNEWLFEWSPNPDFVPAAGSFGKGPHVVFSEKNWRLLAPGRYYGRITRPDCLGIKQAGWMWIKGN